MDKWVSSNLSPIESDRKLSLGNFNIPEGDSDVFKLGMSSGLTHGLINSGPSKIQLPGIEGYGLLITAKGKRGEFQFDGDSGSLAFDIDGAVLGLMNIRPEHIPHQCSGIMIPIGALKQDIENITGGTLSFDV